jgi:mRNA interferase RelE/StbE
MKVVTYSKAATKALRKIPTNDATRIYEKIEQYAGNPEELKNNVIKLQGVEALRLRVGDWRVLFEETEGAIHEYDFGPRDGIYD